MSADDSDRRSEVAPDPAAAVWARVQTVLAAARQDAQAASRELGQMLEAHDPKAGPDAQLAMALVLRGISRLELLIRGRPHDAVNPAQLAVTLLAALADAPLLRERRIGAYGDLANALRGAGRHPEAIAAAQAGLELARGGDDGMAIVRALVRLAGQLADLDRRDESRAYDREALALATKMGDPEAMGLARMGLGLRALAAGAIDAAADDLLAALDEFTTAGNVGDQGAVLQALSAPELVRARPEVARRIARELAARRDAPAPTEEDAAAQSQAERWAEARDLWRRLPVDEFSRLNAAICAFHLGDRTGLAAEFAALSELLPPPPRRHAALMAMVCFHLDAAPVDSWRFAVAIGREQLGLWDVPALPAVVTREYAIEMKVNTPVEHALELLLATPPGSSDERACVQALQATYDERRAATATPPDPPPSVFGWLRRLMRSKR